MTVSDFAGWFRKARKLTASRALQASLVLGSVFQGAAFVLISRTLGPDEFGIFAGAFALASLLFTISGIGGGNVLLMKTSLKPAAFTTSFGTALSYIALTIAPLLAIAVVSSHNLPRGLIFCSIVLVFSECIGSRSIELCALVFQSFDRQKAAAALLIAAAFGRFLAALFFWRLGSNSATTWALVYSVVSVTMGLVFVAIVMIRVGVPELSRSDLARAWRSGALFSLGGLSRVVYMDSDKFLLNRLATATEAGTYSAAFKIVNFAYLPVFAFTYSKNTAFVRAGSDGYASSWRLLRRYLGPVVAYGAAASAGIFILSPLVTRLLGPAYSETVGALRAVGIFVLVEGVSNLFNTALMGLGRQALRGGIQFGVAVMSVVLNLLLIPKFGWAGAAFSVVASSLALALAFIGSFALGLRKEHRRSKARAS